MIRGLSVIEEVLKKVPAGMALDVASGAGNFASAIAMYSDRSTGVIATDAFMKPLEMIRSNPDLKRIIPAAMMADRLAFPGSSFSAAAISNSLHHMENPAAVISEMVRVLAPAGMLIICEMFSDGDQTPSQNTHTMMHNWWGAVDRQNGIVHNPVYDRNSLESLAAKSGAENIVFEIFEDLSGDPFDDQTISFVTKAFDSYMKRAEGNRELEAMGKMAMVHLERHGFSGARALVASGLKPGR